MISVEARARLRRHASVEVLVLLDDMEEMDVLDAEKDAEIARLRDAFEHVSGGGCRTRGMTGPCTCRDFARATLKGIE